MIILGIDPGFDRCGYGIIESDNHAWALIKAGLITTPRTDAMARRLEAIADGVDGLIADFEPDEAAVEQLFFIKNQKSAMRVSQALGAIIVAITKRGVPISEYTPLQIKQALTGFGQAAKPRVRAMVERLLNIRDIAIDDTADALAVALCHSQTLRLSAQIKKQLAH